MHTQNGAVIVTMGTETAMGGPGWRLSCCDRGKCRKDTVQNSFNGNTIPIFAAVCQSLPSFLQGFVT